MFENARKSKILVVDDTPANLEILENILQEKGYVVRCAPNGIVALNIVDLDKPDLILLDINMPDMDGYQVCGKLNENKNTSDIPIIFISAHSDIDDKVKGFELGAVDYISKPFMNAEVVARVQTQVTIGRYQAELKNQNEKMLVLQERLNLAMKSTRMGIWDYDILYDKVEWDDNMFHLINATSKNHESCHGFFDQCSHPDDIEFIQSSFKKSCEGSTNNGSCRFRILCSNGEVRHVINNWYLNRDKDGKAIRATGVIWDETDLIEAQKVIEDLSIRTQQIKDALIRASFTEKIDDSIRVMLEGVSQLLNLPIGHAYLPLNGKKALCSSDIWYCEQGNNLNDLKRIIPNLPLKAGRGLIGKALKEQKSIWVEDITSDPKSLHPQFKQNISIKTAVALPIINKNKTIGILEFFSENIVKSDQCLLDILDQISPQLGTLLEAKKTEEALNESRKMMKAVIDNAAAAIISIDEKGVVQSFNNTAKNMFKYDASEVIGKNIKMLMNEEDHKKHNNYLKNYLLTGIKNVVGCGREVKGLDKDGNIIPIYLAVSDVVIKGQHVFTGIMRDISDLKKAEHQIEQANKGLEIKVKKRTKELEIAKDLAEAANRAKTDFLANMSHELRTPLNAIVGFSQLIEDAIFGPLDEKYQEYGRDIRESGMHLTDLISGILDMTKLQSEEFELTFIDLDVAKEISICGAMLEGKAKKSSLELVLDLEENMPPLNADPLRLKQIIFNIIENAIKFTPKGGKVDVSAKVHNNDEIVIQICDTGIGMAKKDIPRALEQFGQVRQGHTHAHEGAGLGLALSKSMVDLHGGTIDIKSKVDKGTTVTITFPLPAEKIAISPNAA